MAARGRERPWAAVPRPVLAGAALLLGMQLLVRAAAPRPEARAEHLSPPPQARLLRLLAPGDESGSAYTLALRLQAFDNQPGLSLPYARLDYGRVQAWLSTLLELDPRAQYPMLMAAHLYAQVAEPGRQRAMMDFVHRRFLEDPARRWPWLAHVAIMARHRLGDMGLAIRYADALHRHATGPGVPAWVRQMHIFLREEVGEVESARALLGGLLDSGTVTDPHELRLLLERFQALETAGKSTPAPERRR